MNRERLIDGIGLVGIGIIFYVVVYHFLPVLPSSLSPLASFLVLVLVIIPYILFVVGCVLIVISLIPNE